METLHLLENISNTADGVFAVDEDQRIVHWNAGAEDILGFCSEEMLGRFCYDVMGGADGPSGPLFGDSFKPSSSDACLLDCPVVDCAKGGYPTPGKDVRVKAKDGTHRWLSVSHTYVQGDNRGLAAVVHIFRDVTEGMEAKCTLERISRVVSFYAGPSPAKDPDVRCDEELTERERQVVTMLAQGEGTSDIAKKLTISNATARNHIQNILVKLNVHTRLEAVAHVLRNRVIDTS
ncbi:MAG: LuxR C-terminal-related transcriptional regulator [Chloroflexi bacterium]|nr:LuxR C-terminal-related transcriptional regulator [Chloroflexota bacterium]